MVPVRRATGALTALLLASACAAPRPPGAEPSGAPSPVGPSGLPAPETPDPSRDEVLAELESYYADFSARDWSAFASHFWPGATITTVWQPPGEPVQRVVVTSITEFVEQAPQGPGSKAIFEERMLGAEVRSQGNLAHAWAGYTARFGDPGAIEEWRGIDAFTLMKHDGRWRIVALAFTNEP